MFGGHGCHLGRDVSGITADRERSALDRDSEAYWALSKAFERFQQSLADLRSKEPRWKHTGRGWDAT